jgi:hypothetical protein
VKCKVGFKVAEGVEAIKMWRPLPVTTNSGHKKNCPYFKKLMSAYESTIPEPVLMKLDIYQVAPEPSPTAYFINPPKQPICLHVYPVVARQRLHKQFTVATNTKTIKKTGGRTVRVIRQLNKHFSSIHHFGFEAAA